MLHRYAFHPISNGKHTFFFKMRQKFIQWCNDSNRRLKTGKLKSLWWTSLPLCVTLTHNFLFIFNEAPVVFRSCWSPKSKTWSTFGVHHHILAANHAFQVNYTAWCHTMGPVMLMKWDSLHCTTATQPCRECRPMPLLKKERKKWCSSEGNLWPFDHY